MRKKRQFYKQSWVLLNGKMGRGLLGIEISRGHINGFEVQGFFLQKVVMTPVVDQGLGV